MRKTVGACAGHVSIKRNSVCKELELAGAIESSARAVAKVVVVKAYVRSCVGLVNTRKNSVWKELGPVGAIESSANKLSTIIMLTALDLNELMHQRTPATKVAQAAPQGPGQDCGPAAGSRRADR